MIQATVPQCTGAAVYCPEPFSRWQRFKQGVARVCAVPHYAATLLLPLRANPGCAACIPQTVAFGKYSLDGAPVEM